MDNVEVDPLVGKHVANGRYLIQRWLGTGGMGSVYLARQVSMDRMVALKLIFAQTDSQKKITEARFYQEMWVSAKIEHPNTIRVYDYGETEGRLFLAMEYLQGLSLGRIIQSERSLPVARALPIAIQIAKALAAVHQEGVVHRDLKPENIILLNRYGERDFVKILDFGIAHILNSGTERMTAVGGVIGTPAYMAPEQAQGESVDGRTDLYSLGIILYEMLAGVPPFRKHSTMGMLMSQVSEKPPSILLIVPDLPPRLVALLDRLLAKKPEDRPANAMDVIESLMQELGQEEPRQRPPDNLPEPSKQEPVTPRSEAPQSQVEQTQEAPVEAWIPPLKSPRPPTVLMPTPPAPNIAPPFRWGRFGVIVLLLAIGVGGAVTLHRYLLAKRMVQNSAPSKNETAIVDSARARINRRLQDMGESLPKTECLTKDAREIGLLAQALEELYLGKQASAKKAIALLKTASIDFAEAWAMLARAQFFAGDDASVLESAERALALCPNYAAVYNLMGKARQRTGKLNEAEKAFNLAFSIDPGYPAPRFNLALLRIKQGDANSAISILSSLIHRSPDVPHVFLARAQARLTAKDLTGAELDLRESVRRHPKESDGWLLLGQVLHRKGSKTEAYEAQCRAKALGATIAGLSCKE